jgi:hypothetical protein
VLFGRRHKTQSYALLSAEIKTTQAADNKAMLDECHDIVWCHTIFWQKRHNGV